MNYHDLYSFYNNKKVLLTGHTGFKGSYLALILGLMGARVYGYALKPDTDTCLFDILYGSGMSSRNETQLYVRTQETLNRLETIVESRIADIRDIDELEDYYNRIQPEIVIHMAAQPIVRTGYRIPRETYEINVMGTVNILECIRRNPVCKSFLNVTTDKVYLNGELPQYAYKEDDRLDGSDPYSNSKSCSELVTHSYASSYLKDEGVAVSTARAGNCIGGGDFALDRILADALRCALNREPLIVRNPDSVRPYQHVFEPLFVYLEILRRGYIDPGKAGWYNVGPDKEDIITTGRLAQMFVDAFGEGIRWESAEGSGKGPYEAGLLRLDNSKIKIRLDWHPIWHIERGVLAVVDWIKAYREGPERANEELLKQILDYMQAMDPKEG